MHPFDKKRCEWLGMYWIADYCVGFICNWGIHHLDIAAWGCPEVAEAPFEIEGSGLPAHPGHVQHDRHLAVHVPFPQRFDDRASPATRGPLTGRRARAPRPSAASNSLSKM